METVHMQNGAYRDEECIVLVLTMLTVHQIDIVISYMGFEKFGLCL